tara:strand:- start:1133 stop:1318 length:186 start_codon:yes stop_codon:yes gene_type:complete
MVAPYSPTEEDIEKLFEDLPPLNINCERLKRQFETLLQALLISAFFYVIAKSSLTRSFICN